MLTIGVVRDMSDFQALRPEWSELLESSSSNRLFLTWEWLFTWWKHLSDGRRLHLITLRSDGQLIAIAPLALRPLRLTRLLPFRVLEFLGTGSVGSDCLDVIIRKGKEKEALRALADYLSGRHMMLEFGQVDSESPFAAELVSRLKRYGWNLFRTTTNSCPYIDLSQHCWESYFASLGPSHRYNFRRKLRNLIQEFDVELEECRTEEERRRALDTVISLHHKRWNGRGGSLALHTPALLAFHEEISRLTFELGWLRIYILRLNGDPVASVYGFRHADTFYFYQSGFNPDFAKHSIGLLILGLTIKSAMEEGAKEYNLLQGQEAYKYLWAQDERELFHMEMYPPRARGTLYRETMELRRNIKQLIWQYFPSKA